MRVSVKAHPAGMGHVGRRIRKTETQVIKVFYLPKSDTAVNVSKMCELHVYICMYACLQCVYL